jgi:hypothetical protein
MAGPFEGNWPQTPGNILGVGGVPATVHPGIPRSLASQEIV